MTTEQTEEFKDRIELTRSEIARDIRSQTAALTIYTDGSDPIDKVQSMNSRDEAAAKIARLSSTLVVIDHALQKIADGTYGFCVECEEAIGIRRLESIPWAVRCVECQGKLERQQVQRVSSSAWRLDLEAA